MKRIFPLLTIAALMALVVCHREETGWIAVNSTPQGAAVYLDDSLTDEVTNCVLEEVLAGEHHLKLTLDEYESWDSLVVVDVEETTFVNVQLTPVDTTDTTTEGTLLWKYEVEGTITAPAIGPDGTIYFGAYGDGWGYLYAFTPDGARKWWYPAGGCLSAPSVALNGTIYFGSSSDLFSLNPDASVKWRYNPDDGSIGPVAIGTDGAIYFGGDTFFYAVNPDSTLKWKCDGWPGPVGYAPSMGADGTVYFGTRDYGDGMGEGFLRAVNPEDGQIEWSYPFDACSFWCSVAIDASGVVYAAPNDDALYAIYSNGNLKWRNRMIGTGTRSSPALGVDGTIYITKWNDDCDSLFLVAVNSNNGQEKWSYYLNGDGDGSDPAVDSRGTIYVGSVDGYLYALNSDGTLKWEYETEGRVYRSPAIGSDGTLYFGTTNGVFYALKTNSAGLANSPWPRVGHDNQNTGNAACPIR